MINKCFAVFLFLLVSLFCCQAKELTPAKIKDSYAKINKYLEKNVASWDPEENMAEVRKFMQEKMTSGCNLLGGGKSLVETLELLIELAEVPDNKSTCDRTRRFYLLDKVNTGLVDKYLNLDQPNYPLTRVDKIIEHYSFQDILRCEYDLPWTILSYGHKTKAFREIDRLLWKSLPYVEDVDTNMARAEEILKSLDPQNGAVADALRLLLKLKNMLDERTCNDYGYEILLRNDLATSLTSHTYLDRPTYRTAKIYRHYAMKHAELCRSVVPEALRSELKHLDFKFYRPVLGLVGAGYMEKDKYPELMKEIDDSDKGEKNFYTPLIVKFVEDRLAKFEDHVHVDLGRRWLTSREIFGYIQAASAGGPWWDPDFINLYTLDTEGKKVADDNKLMNLLRRYLLDPCKVFLWLFRNLIPADKFSEKMNDRHLKSRKKAFMKELNYHMIHAGYDVCTYVSYNMETIFRTVKAEANRQ